MDKREEVANTLVGCLKKKRVFEFHNLYEESKKLADKNVEEAPCKKMMDSNEKSKEKKMKIKINFKPYIPKIKGNRRKQETEFQMTKKPSTLTKNITKSFIKTLKSHKQESKKILTGFTFTFQKKNQYQTLTSTLAMSHLTCVSSIQNQEESYRWTLARVWEIQ